MNFLKYVRRKTNELRAAPTTHTDIQGNVSISLSSSSLTNGATPGADTALRANYAVQELAMPALADFCARFQHALDDSSSTARDRLGLVKKVKSLSADLVRQTCTLTMQDIVAQTESEGETPLVRFLTEVLQEPVALRGRHALALHRFCTEMEQELEDDVFAAGTGFLSGLSDMNANLAGGMLMRGNATVMTAVSSLASLERQPDIDLAAIYHRLEQDGGRGPYLPTPRELNEILHRVIDVLRAESNIVTVPLPCVVVGDIHGQMRDLLRHVLPIGGPLVPRVASEKTSTYLFLGDYVDRGANSLQCMSLLFVAKLLAPHSVFLLRGNHECEGTNRHYGFLEECHRMYPLVGGTITQATAPHGDDGAERRATGTPNDEEGRDTRGGDKDSSSNGSGGSPEKEPDLDWDMTDHPFWLAANEVFRGLPLCAVLYEEEAKPQEEEGAAGASTEAPQEGHEKGFAVTSTARIVAMHGGLSPYIENSLDGILAIHRCKLIEGGALADLTWSDPMVGDEVEYSSPKLSDDTPPQTDTPESDPTVDRSHAASDAETEKDAVKVIAAPEVDFSVTPVYTGHPTGFAFNPRGVGHMFGEDVTCSFLQENKLRFIVRAHQCILQGYQWSHQSRVLTLFSAPNYCGMGNKGAVLRLDRTGQPEVVQYGEVPEEQPAGIALTAQMPVPPREFS